MVTPDPAAEVAPLPRLEDVLEPAEVGEGTTVLVVVMLDGLAGPEP